MSNQIDWEKERPLIEAAAEARGLDPAFLLAIRQQEAGGPGREFGVLSVEAMTYEEQLNVCAASVAHRLQGCPVNPLIRDEQGRVRYSAPFISYFAGKWAPVGAGNDPHHLNENWLGNVLSFYLKWRAPSVADAG